MKRFLFLVVISSFIHLDALLVHNRNVTQEWEMKNIPSFDELMVSWNATRPTLGKYLFYVSVKLENWSPWLLYASWGSESQESFSNKAEDLPIRVYQDALEILDGKKATGFKIKIVLEETASLDQIYSLHVYTNSDKIQEPKQEIAYPKLINLEVLGLSQMALNYIRNKDLCSPTSTTAVVRYLLKSDKIDPIYFAEHAWDKGFNIFGNWVFNVAEAASLLGSDWECWVDRLSGFDDIYKRLEQKTPVVVSVRSPLKGSAKTYASGHLIAVIGYDPSNQKVICMDPAFSSDNQTHVYYDLKDFVEAWNRRGRVAYIFSKIN